MNVKSIFSSCLILVALALIVLFFVWDPEQSIDNEPAQSPTYVVAGEILPADVKPFPTPVSGVINKIYVRHGQTVKEGQKLMSIIGNNKKQHEIVSPADATVIRIFTNVNETVSKKTPKSLATPLLILGNSKHLIFDIVVNKKDVGNFKRGMQANIRLNAFPGSTITGTVSDISLILPENSFIKQKKPNPDTFHQLVHHTVNYAITIDDLKYNDGVSLEPGLVGIAQIS